MKLFLKYVGFCCIMTNYRFDIDATCNIHVNFLYWSFLRLACEAPLGMESEAVTDSQVSASSQLDGQHSAAKARLHFKTDENKDGGWSSHTSDPNQWLQVDFRSYATVARIATQGRHAHNEWVVNYKLNYSDDGVTFQTCRVPGTNISKVLLCPEKWLSFTPFLRE